MARRAVKSNGPALGQGMEKRSTREHDESPAPGAGFHSATGAAAGSVLTFNLMRKVTDCSAESRMPLTVKD
jgi:hypothetical protein